MDNLKRIENGLLAMGGLMVVGVVASVGINFMREWGIGYTIAYAMIAVGLINVFIKFAWWKSLNAFLASIVHLMSISFFAFAFWCFCNLIGMIF